MYWVTPREILELYGNKLNFSSQLDDSKKTYSEIANELIDPPKKLNPVNNNLKEEKLYEHFSTKECHDCALKEQHFEQQRKRTKTKQEVKVTASRINKN